MATAFGVSSKHCAVYVVVVSSSAVVRGERHVSDGCMDRFVIVLPSRVRIAKNREKTYEFVVVELVQVFDGFSVQLWRRNAELALWELLGDLKCWVRAWFVLVLILLRVTPEIQPKMRVT